MDISASATTVLEKIERAAERAGRSAEDIMLIAVSKQKPVEMLQAAYDAGLRHFGENRSAEFAEKIAHFESQPDMVWHFIGNLQTRQSKPIAASGDWFHAVDRLKIANRLNNQLEEFGRNLSVFLEINVSGEESKHGFDVSNWEADGAQRDAIASVAATISDLSRIDVCGLMTMAPYGSPESDIRRIFQRTRRLREWLREQVPQASWDGLSMGMTDDYEIAIEEGATQVRVGRALFGQRQY